MADYQEVKKQKMANEGYCNKIKTFFEGHLQDENCGCGDRALWELVQNACDQSPEARVEIQLNSDNFVFKHHGRPFDYESFYSLVKQDSSKDQNSDEAEKTVGRYGTGFMTTHTFNKLVRVSAPYAVKDFVDGQDASQKEIVKGYVQIKDFELDRTKIGTPEGPSIMGHQLSLVDGFRDKETNAIMIDDTTSFRYDLTPEQVTVVSNQIQSFARLLPFVLIINNRLKSVRIDDPISDTHLEIKRAGYHVTESFGYDGWEQEIEQLCIMHDDKPAADYPIVYTIKSGKGDVVVIPPFPAYCGDARNIPSLFLWFPLLGTESFGVNFIFHSARFYPVETRDNIMLPGSSTQARKTLGVKNGEIIKEMTKALFKYYEFENLKHTSELSIPFCEVSFPTDSKDEMERAFYNELQSMWAAAIPEWPVIPTKEGKVRISNPTVKLLHSDFFTKLPEETLEENECILSDYAKLPLCGNAPYLFPEQDLIEWSRIVNNWRCGRDAEFFLSPENVCSAIKQDKKGDNLHAFLTLMKLGGNSEVLEKHAVFPNRKGDLCKKGDLYHADFMSSPVYDLVSVLMGQDAGKIVDTDYLDIISFNPYRVNDLQKSITATISQWRSSCLNISSRGVLIESAIKALIGFCSAFSLDNPANLRSKLVPFIAEFYGHAYKRTQTSRFLEQDKEEETFYDPAFNFLVDYTLKQISEKDTEWVKSHKKWLKDFLTTYEPDKNADKKKKLDEFGVLPNQHDALCKMSDLHKNAGVPNDMVTIYDDVFKKSFEAESILLGKWIDTEFENIITLPEDTPEGIASTIQEALVADMKQENRGNRKYETVVRKVILKIGKMPEWMKWFGLIDNMKAKYVFDMKEGDEQESLFKIMDLGKDDLSALARISSAPNLRELLENAEKRLKDDEERERQFRYTYTIGKLIENTLRDEVSSELSCDTNELETGDQQNGQDMVIRYKGEILYYLECKAKWNFDNPAHMSSQQMKQAVRNTERFALICVDCTRDTGAQVSSDATKEQVEEAREDILLHTHVHTDIGDILKPTIESQVQHEDDKALDEEKKVKIYSSLTCNIPKSVFNAGVSFSTFIEGLKHTIRDVVSMMNAS